MGITCDSCLHGALSGKMRGVSSCRFLLAGVTKKDVLWIFVELAERQGPTGKRKAAFICFAFPDM